MNNNLQRMISVRKPRLESLPVYEVEKEVQFIFKMLYYLDKRGKQCINKSVFSFHESDY